MPRIEVGPSSGVYTGMAFTSLRESTGITRDEQHAGQLQVHRLRPETTDRALVMGT